MENLAKNTNTSSQNLLSKVDVFMSFESLYATSY